MEPKQYKGPQVMINSAEIYEMVKEMGKEDAIYALIGDAFQRGFIEKLVESVIKHYEVPSSEGGNSKEPDGGTKEGEVSTGSVSDGDSGNKDS